MFSLIRRRPARPEKEVARRRIDPFLAFRDEMDEMLARFTDGWDLPEDWVEPREAQFEEMDKEVIMRLELPGFEAKEMELRVEGTVLFIRAVHPEAEGASRPAERFEYRLTLPFGTDADHIGATYRNGVLEVHFPKLPEAQPKRIEVKT